MAQRTPFSQNIIDIFRTNHNLTEEKTRMNARIRELELKISTLTTDLHRKEAEIKAKETLMGDIERSFNTSRVESEYEKYKNQIIQLQAEIVRLKSNIITSGDELKHTKDSMENALRIQKAKLEEEKKQELKALEERLNTNATGEYKKYNNQVTELQTEILRLNSTIRNKENEINITTANKESALLVQKSQLEGEKSQELKALQEKLDARILEGMHDNLRLSGEIKTCEDRIRSQAEKIAMQDLEIKTLTARQASEIKLLSEGHASEIKTLTDRQASETASLNQRLDKVNAQSDELVARYVKKKGRLIKAEADLNTAGHTIALLQQERATAIAQHQAEIDALRSAQGKEIRGVIEDHTTELKRINSENEAKQQELKTLCAELERKAQQEKKTHSQELEDAKRREEELRAELILANTNIVNLDSNIRKLGACAMARENEIQKLNYKSPYTWGGAAMFVLVSAGLFLTAVTGVLELGLLISVGAAALAAIAFCTYKMYQAISTNRAIAQQKQDNIKIVKGFLPNALMTVEIPEPHLSERPRAADASDVMNNPSEAKRSPSTRTLPSPSDDKGSTLRRSSMFSSPNHPNVGVSSSSENTNRI